VNNVQSEARAFCQQYAPAVVGDAAAERQAMFDYLTRSKPFEDGPPTLVTQIRLSPGEKWTGIRDEDGNPTEEGIQLSFDAMRYRAAEATAKNARRRAARAARKEAA
jgi:hypothetical protein